MPVMDGHTAMAKILESEKAGKPHIVALTANADTVSRVQGHFHAMACAYCCGAHRTGNSRTLSETRVPWLPGQAPCDQGA